MPKRVISLDIADRIRTVAALPLFSSLPDRELEDVAGWSHLIEYADGEVMVPEGEEGLGFYVVVSGRVRVEREGRVVTTLGPGDFFGEVALLEGGPRGATVRALGSATCLGMIRSHFKRVLVRNPRLALRILDEERRRLVEDPLEPVSPVEGAGTIGSRPPE